MSTETLRMPEHRLDPFQGQRPVCKGSTEPGYAHMNPDGTLHCNRCGWTTPKSVVTALSSTGKVYLTWDELVEAEANGYVVVGVSNRPGTVPAVFGPWESKRDAINARVRLRRKWAKEEAPSTFTTYVRVLWPED